jgi:hypothetical protein
MGQALLCTVRSEGRTGSGKAQLESDEIIFRGEFRLKVPLGSLKSVKVRGGELHLKWPEGVAVFELGDVAERWAYKILHPRSVADKLGIKPELVISAIAIRDHSFHDNLRLNAKAFSAAKSLDNSDLIFLGADTAAGLSRLSKLTGSLASNGALWIVYPKSKQEIREQQVLDAGRQAGLVDVKVVSFSPTHTALKFVWPKAKR